MSESAAISITTVLSILVVVDIAGNSLVCAIIKRNRDMRIPINYLLVNLAVADIVYAAFIALRVLFKLTLTHHPDGVIGTVLCKLLTDGIVAWIGSVSSFVTLIAIAIERYYAVMYPLGNNWQLTKRKLKVIISGSWVFALIFNTPLLLVKDIVKVKSDNFCQFLWPKSWMQKANTLTWLVVVFLLLVLMAALYSRVVYTLWFKHNDDNQLSHQQRGVMKVRKRVTLMVVVVTAIFGICWLMNTVVYAVHRFTPIGSTLLTTSDIMVLFNSAVNPFVYALLNQQFKKKMKRMICCIAPFASRVHPLPEAQNIELPDLSTHPTHAAGPLFIK